MELAADRRPSEALRSAPWWIGLANWVLKDGNYTDFVTGERRQFALEFGYARTKRPRQVAEGSATRCRSSGLDTRYDVTGQVLRRASEPGRDAFILDFGLLAYSQWMVLDDLRPPAAGTSLAGEIYLSVDFFAYMDELAGLPGMPPLIYTWTIDEIQVERTPPMRVEHGHPLYVGPDEGPRYVHDPAPENWTTVAQTRAWDHDDSYRLRCTLEDAPPTSTMAASGPESPYGPLRPR